MVDILGDAGKSIADVYDVRGSIVGIESLEAREVQLVHEMGGTLFSERVSGFIRQVSSGAIAQNTNFDVLITDLPAGIFRILGILVTTNASGRTNQATVSLRDRIAGREMPLFAWHTTPDSEVNIRVDLGSGAANVPMLLVASPIILLPNLAIGTGQPQRVSDVAFRGSTSGFGAGTVTLILSLYVAFSQVGGLSSRGLPVPSW